MTKKRGSLERHIRQLSLRWMTAGLALTLGLCVSILCWLPLKEAESQIGHFSKSIIASRRIEILSGDVRAVQLQLKTELALKENEVALFLDSQKRPWLEDPTKRMIQPCEDKTGVCRNVLSQLLISYEPIFFDSDRKNLWGYLYVEKYPKPNWPLVLSVTLAIVLVMFVQAIGFYSGLARATNKVGQSLKEWAGRISLHPKNRDNYTTTPYSEIAPIEAALHRLSSEIESLTDLARKEGALSTLRSVGHDILNPVSRMKRIIGVLKAENRSSVDSDLVSGLEANVKRLSAYAEQLKFIYKNQVGEQNKSDDVANVSNEIASLARELSADPLTQDKRLHIECSVEPDLIAMIPPAALGRVIENLCTNSIQASSPGGKVQLFAKRKSERIVVTISDEGHGISEKLKAKVFEAGFTSRPNQGTGLGLFVVKQICEQYGGNVALSSEESKGTTISIELPRMEASDELQASIG